MLLAKSSDRFWIGKAILVSKRVADVCRDVGDPLVIVGRHGDHEAFVFLAINFTGQTVKKGPDGRGVTAGEAWVVEEGRSEEVSYLSS